MVYGQDFEYMATIFFIFCHEFQFSLYVHVLAQRAKKDTLTDDALMRNKFIKVLL